LPAALSPFRSFSLYPAFFLPFFNYVHSSASSQSWPLVNRLFAQLPAGQLSMAQGKLTAANTDKCRKERGAEE